MGIQLNKNDIYTVRSTNKKEKANFTAEVLVRNEMTLTSVIFPRKEIQIDHVVARKMAKVERRTTHTTTLILNRFLLKQNEERRNADYRGDALNSLDSSEKSDLNMLNL